VNLSGLLNANLSELLGPEAAAYDWPFKSMLNAGAKVIFSSDCPAGTLHPDWRLGVQSAVLREGMEGKVIAADQRITRQEALRAYTMGGAWQDHMENIKGSIEDGKLANFCILGGDILTCDAHQIKNFPVLMTVVGGRVVYDPAGALADVDKRAASRIIRTHNRARSWGGEGRRPSPPHSFLDGDSSRPVSSTEGGSEPCLRSPALPPTSFGRGTAEVYPAAGGPTGRSSM